MWRTTIRILLATFYGGAGVLHLTSPAGFVAITPDWVPFPQAVVAFTGLAEIAGAVGLMVPRFRKAAGVALALYALCVWPANFNHAINDITIGGANMSWWYHGPRLTLQPLIIWLALWAGGATDWSFRKIS
jgi:uncharacterized membrane protein